MTSHTSTLPCVMPSSPSSLSNIPSFPHPSPSYDSTLSSVLPSPPSDNVNIKPYDVNVSKQLNKHKMNADRDIYLEPSNPQCIKIYMSPGLFKHLIIPALYDLPINEPIKYDDLFCTLTNLRRSYAKCGKSLQVVDATFSLKSPSSNSTIRIHAYVTESMLMT